MSTTAATADRQERPEQAGEHEVSNEQRDSTVLSLMLCDESGAPWSVEELTREIGDRVGVTDAVCRLAAAGLVHRIGEFVFPTLAARRADALREGAI